MNEQQQSVNDLLHIRKMMERSSRFISLSGLSGVSAGLCAIAGCIVAHPYVYGQKDFLIDVPLGLQQIKENSYWLIPNTWLFWIAAITFCGAAISAFIFTWIKSKKQGIPLWGTASRRLSVNVGIPLVAGGLFIIKILNYGAWGLVAPACLIFYGLALVNASKYTLNEVRYLGYSQIILGLLNLLCAGCGLYFWAAGFGVMHIIYGVYMWWVYDRAGAKSEGA